MGHLFLCQLSWYCHTSSPYSGHKLCTQFDPLYPVSDTLIHYPHLPLVPSTSSSLGTKKVDLKTGDDGVVFDSDRIASDDFHLGRRAKYFHENTPRFPFLCRCKGWEVKVGRLKICLLRRSCVTSKSWSLASSAAPEP
ncbi:hypothetical protein K470DRAFT_26428 [Piedraia hortae CBS 480.64]|uniref:Uncharacterized protein n=1 Tax=Piedraia hortae CBS 480.64 TaxID=1314780 RepID=A0A6A7C5H1_9PEZI|nr:hypothetical protein K470DRAFT_26428 [Piedraia hortae CBS 480.64]